MSPTFFSMKWCEKISDGLLDPSYWTSPSQVTITVDCSPAMSKITDIQFRTRAPDTCLEPVGNQPYGARAR